MLKKELEELYQKSLQEISDLKKELSELKNVKEQNLQLIRAEEKKYDIWKRQNEKFLIRFLRENLYLDVKEKWMPVDRLFNYDDMVKSVELKIGKLEK